MASHSITWDRALPITAGLLSLLVGLAAVSHESLWIDEANSALKAMQPSLVAWWNVLAAEKGSDLQMPLFMLQLWAWTKIVGANEFALRSANIVWFCVGQCALAYALRRTPGRALLILTLGSISPLLWYYLNDARPYLMQFAGACILGAVIFRAVEEACDAVRPVLLWAFGAGLIILCGSSLLGVIWAAGAIAAWWYLVRDELSRLRSFRSFLPVAATLTLLGLLGGFYLWTVMLGTGASAIGNTGLRNVAFIGYELLGGAGLGPGRLRIREEGFEAFRENGTLFLLPALGVILTGGILLYGARAAMREMSTRAQVAAFTYSIPPALLLLALGYWQHFRLLGRHFIPLVPPLLGLLVLGISRLWLRQRTAAISTAMALLTAWLASSLALRFCDRHRKDDYRSAAEAARAGLAQKEIVWWSADRAAALYYHVPVSVAPEQNAVTLVLRPLPDELEPLPRPDMVISSKPDIYDGRADALGAYLAEHRFTRVRDLPAFTIWRKAADPSEPR